MLGYDCLYLLHKSFSVKAFLSTIGDGPYALGFLGSLPDANWDNLRDCLETGKFKRVRAHVWNAVCCRNKNCCKSEGMKGWTAKDLDKEIRAGNLDNQVNTILATLAGFYMNYPATEWYVSPLLEHDQSEQAWKRIADDSLSWLPAAQLVNCPHTGWKGKYKGSLTEGHGTNGFSKDVFSLDGQDLFDDMNLKDREQMRKAAKKKEYGLSWTWDLNGRSSGKVRTCPEKRKGFPDKKRWKKIVIGTEKS